MKEEIVFIIPMRSYYPVQSYETLFEYNLISSRLIASYGITCLCHDSLLFSSPSASIKRPKLLLWPCILFQVKAILSSDKNDAASPFYFSRPSFPPRLNEGAAAPWRGSALKMSLGAGDARRPAAPGGALASKTESSQNERGKKTEQKGAVAKI